MPFIAHSPQEIQDMLRVIGIHQVEDLFNEIPSDLLLSRELKTETGLSEQTLTQLLIKRSSQDTTRYSFIGAGAYEHFIPAMVWAIASRGEFMTAYTPYQPEASQGSLQLIYEYQSLMTELLHLDASNASLYDGASALAEAILMALRIHKKTKSQPKVLIVGPVSPNLMDTLGTITLHQGVSLHEISATEFTPSVLENTEYTAVVIAQPNFLGQIVEVDTITTQAQKSGSIVIAYVNPTAMALLKPPGLWGERGVDIACGEGQPLGIPLSLGGPYFGFLCCKLAHIRQMPGRIVGQTKDTEGKTAYCLTLQAREQHIRRAKATSNICTNQGLMVTAATIYMTLLGAAGLTRVAMSSHQNALYLIQHLTQLKGVILGASGPFYCEFPLCLPVDAQHFLKQMDNQGIQAGYLLNETTLLISTTEIHAQEDLDHYLKVFAQVLNEISAKDHSYALHS